MKLISEILLLENLKMISSEKAKDQVFSFRFFLDLENVLKANKKAI